MQPGRERGSARPVPAPLLDGDPGTGGEAGSGVAASPRPKVREDMEVI